MVVELTGWREGMLKVSLTHLIREAGHSLSDAKRCVDELLDGQTVSIAFTTKDEAAIFLERASKIGAVGHLIDNKE